MLTFLKKNVISEVLNRNVAWGSSRNALSESGLEFNIFKRKRKVLKIVLTMTRTKQDPEIKTNESGCMWLAALPLLCSSLSCRHNIVYGLSNHTNAHFTLTSLSEYDYDIL